MSDGMKTDQQPYMHANYLTEVWKAYPTAGALIEWQQQQIEALRMALMRRIQTKNCCRTTGIDCGIRGGGLPCSCNIEAQNDVEDLKSRH